MTASTLVPRPMEMAQSAAVRALIPAAFPAIGRTPDCLVMIRAGAVVAAGAMGWVPNGFPVLIGVVPGERRRGHGRALIEALATRARGETPGLRGWRPLAEDDPQACLLRSAGFEVRQRLHVFEAEPTRFGDAMTALVARLGSRVPAGASLLPLAAVPPEALGALLADQFALREAMLSSALRESNGATGGWDGELSRVLQVDGMLAGAILARRSADVAEVDFNVVAPKWRGGWANVLLVEALVSRVRAVGLPLVRFLAEPHVRDTANLSRRAGGRQLADQLVLVRPLAG